MQKPSVDQWMLEAKQSPDAEKIGMYLVHNGTVRGTARAEVRQEAGDRRAVHGMRFSYNVAKAAALTDIARKRDGIFYVRVWLNEGRLSVGDDLMLVLVGGDTRVHVLSAMDFLIGRLKEDCVDEQELFD